MEYFVGFPVAFDKVMLTTLNPESKRFLYCLFTVPEDFCAYGFQNESVPFALMAVDLLVIGGSQTLVECKSSQPE